MNKFAQRFPAAKPPSFWEPGTPCHKHRYWAAANFWDKPRQTNHCLSGPDGSRHSSDQHPKDANSKNSNYCPIFVREFLSSRRQTPEVWNFCVFTVFEFLSHLPRNSRASRGRKFQFFVFFVFCGLKLLRACLKAPALTGYVGGRPKSLLDAWGF